MNDKNKRSDERDTKKIVAPTRASERKTRRIPDEEAPDVDFRDDDVDDITVESILKYIHDNRGK